MEAAYLCRAALQVRARMTIVKAVCNFGDGKKNKLFQPTKKTIDEFRNLLVNINK